jgi:hypothetical protein
MDPTTILLLLILGAVIFVLILRPKKCGTCLPEDFIPLNGQVEPEARAQARLAITYLDHLKTYGEDPADIGNEVDPEKIVMIQGGYDPPYNTYRKSEKFSATQPSTEIEPNRTARWWYYNYPYQLVADNNGTGKALNGGGISSNWWIGARFRQGMFPAAKWSKWNGQYMYIANDGVTGRDKVAPLG